MSLVGCLGRSIDTASPFGVSLRSQLVEETSMATQEEVMVMQETELQGVMPAKIADAVLVVIS